jgi:ribosomal protein L7/L12
VAGLLAVVVIIGLIGSLAAVRTRTLQAGLRARRQFLLTATGEILDSPFFVEYFERLLHERGYEDLRVENFADNSATSISAFDAAGRPVVFRYLSRGTYISGTLVAEIADSWTGKGASWKKCIVTTTAADAEVVNVADLHGLTVIDRSTIEAWMDLARGADLTATLSAEMLIPQSSDIRVLLPPEISLLARRGKKIEAIKLYRQLNPEIELRKAKDVIMRLSEDLPR